MIEPVYDRGGIQIFNADCRDVLPQLEAESVDLVLTDPPYGLGSSDLGWAEKGYKRISETWNVVLPTDWIASAIDAMKPGASLLCFMAWKTCDCMLHALDASGLTRRDVLVWDKINTMPNITARGYQYTHEFIAWHTKGSNYVWTPQTQVRDVLRYTWSQERRWHPSQKTVPLVAGLIERHSLPGSVVLDMFLGSGTTLVAAKQLGRRALGVELSKKYCDVAINRLRQEVMTFEMAE